jgi:serine protease
VVAALGGGMAIAANAPVTHQAVTSTQQPQEFVGISPVRVLDTRAPIGVPTKQKLGQGQSIDVVVAGINGIPADATSVAVNITIDDDATLKSFLTVWPTGETRPNASANNAEPGFVSPNSAIFKVGTGGKLSVFNQQGTVNVIIDVTGYFVASSTSSTSSTTSSSTTSSTTTAAPTS